MCGIVGVFYKSKDTYVSSELVDNMLSKISHRGPDGKGVYCKNNFGMGMVRLAIVDKEEHTLPYFNEDKSLCLAYNGEIYNYKDLFSNLKLSHVRTNNSDSEFIIHAWEELGIKAVKEFNGMYAFAIYDRKKDKLTLVRDKIGEKPLYYYEDDKKVLFASEIKSILTVISPEHDVIPASYKAFEFCCGKETLFCNIYAVEPGDYIEICNGRLNIKSYWKVWDEKLEIEDNEKKIENDLTDLLVDSVLLRTKNNVHPLGCMVSGGVDSALAACISKPDYIYTGSYDIGDEFNELSYAQLVAKKIKRELVIIKPTKEDFITYKEKIMYHLDMPSTWTSFNLFMLASRASKDVRVMMSGEGMDELFGGYHRYHLLNHDQKIFELQAMEKYHYLIQQYYGAPESRYMRLINRNDNQFDEATNRYLIDLITFYFQKAGGIIHGMGLTDFYTSMQVLLTMADRMSMAFNIENRSPFLDYRLVRYAYSMPEKYKIKDGITKHIIKKIARKFIPREIADRADKKGFVAPVNIWFDWQKNGKFNRYEYKIDAYKCWERVFFNSSKA